MCNAESNKLLRRGLPTVNAHLLALEAEQKAGEYFCTPHSCLYIDPSFAAEVRDKNKYRYRRGYAVG